ncbi:MAG TPA: hypothetical protein VN541_09230, partial [Tepidisphaeraceae bacterium]|nr:hypothetical protein [Tepidisphaeraceae bacterium]
ELVREQLGRLERALKDLEDQVRPRRENQFRVMSEGYVEHIAKLPQEIGEYESRREKSSGLKAHTPTAHRRPA